MKNDIGIALSGGGASGIAHIGVLHALNGLGIFPARISGTSAGALIGAFYAAGIPPLQILEIAHGASFSKIFRFSFFSNGLTDHRYLQEILIEQIGDIDFDELKLPLSVGVTNIDEGRFELFDSGKLVQAVKASCTIPLLFNPVEINGISYIDGGVTNNLPVEPLLPVCDKVIGVGVNRHTYDKKISGKRDIGLRSFQLAVWNTMEERMRQCDIALDISEASVGLFELSRADELFEIGKKAVETHAKEFELLLNGEWHINKIFT